MNNLNDPPQWNIDPQRGGDRGDGSRWNYALLVPMLSLAVLRYIWDRDTHKEVEKAKAESGRETYRVCLAKEQRWQIRATNLLSDVEDALMERQNIFCSAFLPRGRRLEMEENLLHQADTDPIARELQLKAGLRDIFRYDGHCADLTNKDLRKNGKLMWVYLKYWEMSVQTQKFKKIENRILGKNKF
ncbi:coiled-coil domain-containing protein 127-like [Lissotriton helveticus]